MPELRIKVELNKGRKGMPLDKLAAVAGETVQFLNLFSRDLGFGEVEHKWLAEKFENESVDFDCRFVVPLDEQTATRGRKALRMVMANDYADSEISVLIRPETRRQFAKISHPIDPDEVIRFGLYGNGEPDPHDWFELTRSLSGEIEQPLNVVRRSFGEVQAIVHAFFKETDRPYLKVRELSTQQLVNCYFKPEMYSSAVDVLAEQDAVVFVEGWTTENPDTGFVTEIEVTDFRLAPIFSAEQFRTFVGAIPDYTGQLSSKEALDQIRDE